MQSLLDHFNFRSLWSPFFLLIVVSITVIYLLLIGPLRHKFAQSEEVSEGKQLTLIAGLASLYIAYGSPLFLYGHLVFSAHMLSMSIAYIIAPPLVLLGLPAWLLRPIADKKLSQKAAFLLNPVFTIFLFNGLFSIYHMPLVHDYVMTHYVIHISYDLLLLITAFMMWWPVINPIPGPKQMSDLKKMGYMFANGMLLTPACALITFMDTPMYSTYTDPQMWAQALGFCCTGVSVTELLQQFSGPQFFALLPPLQDQQLGGIVMKVMQEIVYGFAIGFIFFHWYKAERKNNEDELSMEPADGYKEAAMIQSK